MGRSQRHLIEQQGNASNGEMYGEGVVGQGAQAAPVLTSVNPNTEVAGAPDVLITATGTGFAPNSVVVFNGAAQATTYVSDTSLTTMVDASAAVAGVVPVRVRTGPFMSAPVNFTFM